MCLYAMRTKKFLACQHDVWGKQYPVRCLAAKERGGAPCDPFADWHLRDDGYLNLVSVGTDHVNGKCPTCQDRDLHGNPWRKFDVLKAGKCDPEKAQAERAKKEKEKEEEVEKEKEKAQKEEVKDSMGGGGYLYRWLRSITGRDK